jgi:hypothetical protein
MYYLGRLIRFLHLVGKYVIILFTLLFPSKQLLWFWIPMFVSNVVYGKCIITKIEMMLTGENITVVDRSLILLGFEITNQNRKKITLITTITIFIYLAAHIGQNLVV